MRRLVLIVLTGLLGGCVDQLAMRQQQLSQLVGRPEAELIQMMGVPSRSYESGGVKYLAYTDGRVEVVPAFPYNPPPWVWYGPAFPPQVVTLVCETTFAVSDGLVRSYTLRGNACG
jgi:hypothetical protein